MENVDLRIMPIEGQDAVSFEMVVGGSPLAHADLDANDLDHVIAMFSAARASLADEVPRDLEPQVIMESVFDPAWKFPVKHSGQGKVLALRHPGLGWLAFDFPEHEANEISQWLSGARP